MWIGLPSNAVKRPRQRKKEAKNGLRSGPETTGSGRRGSDDRSGNTYTAIERTGEHSKMKLRALGKSDLHITPIGIGSWAIGGGKWEFGWGAQDDRQSIAAIHAGL